MTVLFGDHELKARELLATVESNSLATGCVKIVFKAMYHAAMTVDHIERVAEAITTMPAGTLGLQDELTRLVKAKVLRSRKSKGKRLYELNY